MPPPESKARRIAVMGFRSVGKSSLTIQFVENQFVDSYDPTIENTFDKHLKINGLDYMLKIIDTAGQDEYSIFPQAMSVNIHGYVLVYAVTSPKSWEVVQIIHEKLLDMTGKVNVPIVLVGNKTDLHMERSISTQQGKQLADSWGATFVESSAKQNESVEEIFKAVLKQIDGNSEIKDEKCSIL